MSKTWIVTIALGLSFACTACWADYGVIDKGEWPDTWPKELDVLRQQSRTLVGPMLENRHYAIRFTNQEEFEKLWPLLLSVKTKDAPVMLVKGPNFFLGKEAKAGVVVHCPPEDDAKVPATLPPAINADNYRQLLTHSTYIELVVDGTIIDLNRIPLSTECLVIDQRFAKPAIETCERRSGCNLLCTRGAIYFSASLEVALVARPTAAHRASYPSRHRATRSEAKL